MGWIGRTLHAWFSLDGKNYSSTGKIGSSVPSFVQGEWQYANHPLFDSYKEFGKTRVPGLCQQNITLLVFVWTFPLIFSWSKHSILFSDIKNHLNKLLLTFVPISSNMRSSRIPTTGFSGVNFLSPVFIILSLGSRKTIVCVTEKGYIYYILSKEI